MVRGGWGGRVWGGHHPPCPPKSGPVAWWGVGDGGSGSVSLPQLRHECWGGQKKGWGGVATVTPHGPLCYPPSPFSQAPPPSMISSFIFCSSLRSSSSSSWGAHKVRGGAHHINPLPKFPSTTQTGTSLNRSRSSSLWGSEEGAGTADFILGGG